MQVKLYEARKNAKLTQDSVSEALGISRVSYGKKERGEVPFTLDEMFSLKLLLGMELEDIFLPRGNQ